MKNTSGNHNEIIRTAASNSSIHAYKTAWHIHDSEMVLFHGLPVMYDFVWDGHTTQAKYQMLIKYFCEAW